MIPDQTIDRVRSAANIVETIGHYLELKRSGRDYVAICPFHNDTKPSLTISEEKQIYKCFSCGASGDVFSFVAHMEREEFPQAVRRLAKAANIHIEETQYSPEQKEAHDQAKQDRDAAAWVNKQAADLYEINLHRDPERLAYFTGRGFTVDTIRAWRLGFAGPDRDQLKNHLAKVAPGKEEKATAAAETAALIRTHEESGRKYEFYRDRYIFPIHDHRGRLVAFTGRHLDPKAAKQKYINTADASPIWDKSRTLYGLDKCEAHTRTDRRLIICEGNTDTIALHQTGFPYAVATCGTALTDEHIKLIKRYADEIILCFDNDKAGKKATPAAIKKCIAAGLSVKVANNAGEDVKDPADLMLQKGEKAFDVFSAWFDHAVDGWDYLLRTKGKDAQTPAAIAKAIDDLVAIIRTHPSTIAQDLMIKDLSKATGVTMKQIKEGTKQKRKPSNNSGSETTRLPEILANMDEQENALHIMTILDQLLDAHGQDLGVLGGNLFAARKRINNAGQVVEYLGTPDGLFYWVHKKYQAVRWKDTGLDELAHSYVSKGQFYKAILGHAQAYLGVSAYPYEPQPKEIFVRWRHPDYEPTGEHLDAFLDFFNPATDADRGLITALLLTMIWGGKAGQRPLFVICPEERGTQQAIGKSHLAVKCAKLVGGNMSLNMPKKGSFADGIEKQALEKTNLNYRVALIDNVTGTIHDNKLADLITAPMIAGRAAYSEAAERSNVITWIITTNEPNLSTDISSRTVLIRLAPADRKARPAWEYEIDEYISNHGDRILADAIARLKTEPTKTTTHTRFPAWDNAVLGRIEGGEDLVQHITKEQEDADRDREEITEFIYELADNHPCQPGGESVLKLYQIATTWNDLHTNSQLSPQQVSQIVKNALSRGNLTGKSGAPLISHEKRNRGRMVWVFRPWDIDESGGQTGEAGGGQGLPAYATMGDDIEF